MKKILPYLFIVLLIFVFFWQFFLKGLLPIPADTIIGLYHPFRDLYASNYPNGIPFKNFLITDPVRQQYPWRELVISVEKKFELPLWNPYNFAGTPLLANFQSAPFYILNVLFFAMPFQIAWSLIILLGPLLGGIFMFTYLNNLRLSKWGSLLGSISFAFCGFSVAWMEWGTIIQTAIWLPLILLAIDKLIANIKEKKFFVWIIVYLLSMLFSFFAGHLQTFFYIGIFSFCYFVCRWWQYDRKINILVLYLILSALFIIVTSIQWLPTLQMISLSGRNVDTSGFNNPGWFIPWQNLIQFIAPDFFGNPATLNYWGVWNYGEFVGYAGITVFILAFFAIFFRYDKKTLFFGSAFFISLILSLPNFISKIPFSLHIPFIETAQPTRLLFLVDFSLAVLGALGFDYYLKNKKKIIFPLVFVAVIFVLLWGFVLLGAKTGSLYSNIVVAKSNLIFPSIIMLLSAILLFLGIFVSKLNVKFCKIIYLTVILLVAFDLLRFAWKFSPFTDKNYLFPQTQAISFLQKQKGQFRIAATDSRIFPPNFSSIYGIQSVDGYDPLYILRYGELIAAMERGRPDISPPFGFNRIITPHNYESRIMDLLGVKYFLSLSPLNSPKLTKVFQEGQTIIYENKNAIPRVFFVNKVILSKNNQESINILFDPTINLIKTGIVEDEGKEIGTSWSSGSAEIIKYSANNIFVNTENKDAGFLILTDTFYPTWRASVDGKQIKIYIADYNFRGIVVPSGEHSIEFNNSLF
jgi:hypothetical protein